MSFLIALTALGCAALIPASACYFCRTCKLSRCGNAFAPDVTRKHQLIVQLGNLITIAVALIGFESFHGWQLFGMFFALLLAFGTGEFIGLHFARKDESEYDAGCTSLYQTLSQAREASFLDFQTRSAGLPEPERTTLGEDLSRTCQAAWESHEAQRRNLYQRIFRR